ncbi:MAG: hypothetical protein GY822_12935, partial [Deltaproteobacteria bacterium]|nr:hypothetical protein [Deltaproteobacteria bacterium]
MTNVTLSAAMRSNLLSLQSTQGMLQQATGRMTTGLKISSPIDDAVKFFQSKALNDRASDLNDRKSQIDQGVSTLDVALETTGKIEELLSQMKGIVSSAATKTESKTERTQMDTQLIELSKQIENLVNDASYQGLNLLNSASSKLSVRFSEKADSKLEVNGVDFRVKDNDDLFKSHQGTARLIGSDLNKIVEEGLGFAANLGTYTFTGDAVGDEGDQGGNLIVGENTLDAFNLKVKDAVQGLENTISNVRAAASNLATNAAILNVRSDFTEQYVNILDTGSGKLVLADIREEAANAA